MKRFSALLILLCLISVLFPPAHARADTTPYFTFSLDSAEVQKGGMVRLKVNANRTDDTAAGFRLRVGYDHTVLDFVRSETSSQIKAGTMMTNGDSNPICSVYVCDVDQKAAPVLSGNIITFVFKVRDGASEGSGKIDAHIDQICNFQAQQLNLNYDENLAFFVTAPTPVPSGQACLVSLIPQTGRLVPRFSSDVFEYEMDVAANIRSVEFEAAAGYGGTVKINRKTLGKAGSGTLITVTVTSADKTEKALYYVTVYREAAAASATKEAATVQEASESKASSRKAAADSVRSGSQSAVEKNAVKGAGRVKAASSRVTEDFIPQAVQDEESVAAVPATIQPAAAVQGSRTIYIIGNQMPTYVIVLLAAVVLIQLGMILGPWLNIGHSRKGGS